MIEMENIVFNNSVLITGECDLDTFCKTDFNL